MLVLIIPTDNHFQTLTLSKDATQTGALFFENECHIPICKIEADQSSL